MTATIAETSLATVFTAAIIVAGVVALGVMAFVLTRRMLDDRVGGGDLIQLEDRIGRLEDAVRRIESGIGPGTPASARTVVEAIDRPPQDRAAIREAILDLDNRGFSSREIASQLSQPIGEIELTLALERAGRRA